MDVLTIQWGFIGGYPRVGVIPPTPPVPPAPIAVVQEPRRWPGPSSVLYTDEPALRRKREDEEILFL